MWPPNVAMCSRQRCDRNGARSDLARCTGWMSQSTMASVWLAVASRTGMFMAYIPSTASTSRFVPAGAGTNRESDAHYSIGCPARLFRRYRLDLAEHLGMREAGDVDLGRGGPQRPHVLVANLIEAGVVLAPDQIAGRVHDVLDRHAGRLEHLQHISPRDVGLRLYAVRNAGVGVAADLAGDEQPALWRRNLDSGAVARAD